MVWDFWNQYVMLARRSGSHGRGYDITNGLNVIIVFVDSS